LMEEKAIVQRMNKIGERIFEDRLEIQPMFKCLNNRACRHLDAPGKVSPMCEIAVDGIFNLRQCPLGRWKF